MTAAGIDLCGAENPDYPGEYRCTWPDGHGRIIDTDDRRWDHASDPAGAYWNGAVADVPERCCDRHHAEGCADGSGYCCASCPLAPPAVAAQGLAIPRHLVDGLATADPAVEVEDPWIESEEQAAERRRNQRRAKHARWEERLPEDYRHASLSDFEEPLAGALLRAYRDPAVRNIVLAGPYDAGKTHAAYALGQIAVDENRWVEAWTVFDLMKQMLPDGDPILMNARARGCSVLILDDLGATKASEFAVETLTAILDHRVSRRLLTIVTTNAQEDALTAVWGGRLTSRLRHGLASIRMEARGNRQPAW